MIGSPAKHRWPSESPRGRFLSSRGEPAIGEKNKINCGLFPHAGFCLSRQNAAKSNSTETLINGESAVNGWKQTIDEAAAFWSRFEWKLESR
jgi:hypothetical protein